MMLLLILIIHYFLLGIYFIFYIKYVLLLKGKALHYDVILAALWCNPRCRGYHSPRRQREVVLVPSGSAMDIVIMSCLALLLLASASVPSTRSKPYCRQHRTTGGVVYWTLLHRGERLNTLLLMEVERLPDSCHEVWTPPCNKYTF